MKFVKVFLRRALSSFDRIYSYKVPDDMIEQVTPGRRILIPFGRGNRLEEAFVFANHNLTDKENPEKIKEIAAVLDDYPLLDLNQIKLISQMKQRYACTYGQAASTMLPAGFNLQLSEFISINQDGLDVLKNEHEQFLEDFMKLADIKTENKIFEKEVPLDKYLLAGYRRSDIIELAKSQLINLQPSSKQQIKREAEEYCYLTNIEETSILLEEHDLGSIQQEAAVEYLLEVGASPVQELLEACNVKRTSLKTLEKKGLLEFEHRKVSTENLKIDEFDFDLLPVNGAIINDDDLSSGQREAIKEISASINNKAREEFLLYGITGSGKTEVYIRACREVLAKGETAIVLVPEIGLTPQMLSSFKAHFPDEITVLHSGLTPRERFNRWEKIRSGVYSLVIGARSAIFAPLNNIGLIVIDEEQEDTYESDNSPYYHARTIARLRAINENATLVLGSATPSLETFHRAQTGKTKMLKLEQRAGQAKLPDTHLIDLREDWNSDTEGVLSNTLIDAMRDALSRDEQVLLFLNRRGYARTCLCRDCGKALECQNCSVTYTYHQDSNLLICHYCGASEKIPTTCPNCENDALFLHGIGTQKLEAMCKQLFPDNKVIRMDQDSSRNAKKQAELFNEFRNEKSAILIGTQMIAKGHNFPNLTVVGILSVDQMMARNDFRANEKAFQLITQAAGRAGRNELAGTVYTQAFDLDHYVVQTSSKHDFDEFSAEELDFRQTMIYPPHASLAYINISSPNETEAKNEAKKLNDFLRQLTTNNEWQDITVMQAAPSALYRLQGRWRWNIVLKSSGENQVRNLSTLWQYVSLKIKTKDTRISFRLDPA